MSQKKEYKLGIGPRVLELLGPNLYTNIYYVLSELIANAYDADASNVYVIIEDDRIVIEDDGHGMSYDKNEIDKFLQVGTESRTNAQNELSKNKQRFKMGRKGIGKLAALSISDEVYISTVSEGEKSGFILTKDCGKDGELEGLTEDQIKFIKIQNNGTSIVLKNPKLKIGSIGTIKKNISKLFTVNFDDFKIHIKKGGKEEVISDAIKEIADSLIGIYLVGEKYIEISKKVEKNLVKNKKIIMEDYVKKLKKYTEKIELYNKKNELKEYEMEIEGWFGIYESTRGMKTDVTEFSLNHISVFSRGKMGIFNILPEIGKNKVNEAYIVGQICCDLFEETELPDMSLSNRQGYKDDDPRFFKLKKYLRDEVLDRVLEIRNKYALYNKDVREKNKNKKIKKNEEKLTKDIKKFEKLVLNSVSKDIKKIKNIEDVQKNIKFILDKNINQHFDSLGIKKKKANADADTRKILICHTENDKVFCDILFKLLIECEFDSSEIIYTSCDEAGSRIPDGKDIFDYLREFFVKSISLKKLFVFYITSPSMAHSWGAMSEVGAGWITKTDHRIVAINTTKYENEVKQKFQPKSPLNVGITYVCVEDIGENEYKMNTISVDELYEKIKSVSKIFEKKLLTKDKMMEILRDSGINF